MKPQSVPRVGQPIADVVTTGGKMVAQMNYWLFQTLRKLGRNPDPAPAALTVTASPMVYENSSDYDLDVIVSGGTVSSVGFSRDGATFYPMPVAGSVRLNPGDSVRIAYSVAPTLVVLPR